MRSKRNKFNFCAGNQNEKSKKEKTLITNQGFSLLVGVVRLELTLPEGTRF
nr:MAG TPA: hypothetical protein [Caudoviricetes sp.]